MISGSLRHRNIRPLWAVLKRHATRPSTNGSKNDGDDDFFGIKHFTANDVQGTVALDDESKAKLDGRVERYQNITRMKEASDGYIHTTTFGAVRYDRDNKVEVMGQFEESFGYSSVEAKRHVLLNNDTLVQKKGGAGGKVPPNDPRKDEVTLNIVEEQYFGETAVANDETGKPAQGKDKDELNYIDYQYFKEQYAPDLTPGELPSEPIKFQFTPDWEEYREVLDSVERIDVQDYRRPLREMPRLLENLTFAGDSPLKSLEEVSHELTLLKQRQEKDEDTQEGDEKKLDVEEEIDGTGYVKPEPPKTAFEYVMQLRNKQIEPEEKAYLKEIDKRYKEVGSSFNFKRFDPKQIRLDSQGKRNYKGQVPDLNLMRKDELVEYLKQRVLFNERDIIAINKPYGLVVEGGEDNKKYPLLENLLPDLSKALFGQEGQLHLVHRLDRDTTGVLLLARSLSMVSTLRDLLAKRLISKYYWTITRGIPDPMVGIIDIPIERIKVDGKERMVLRPECDDDFNREMNLTRRPRPATTHYRVLRKAGNACLVEVRPEQGIRHQIRVHLGFALRTPILGDHKYSHLDKIMPQILPSDMLAKLNVRKSKVRTIPMHLHAKMYMIPGLGATGGNITISAHLPGYFKANMSSLDLTSSRSVIKTPIAF